MDGNEIIDKLILEGQNFLKNSMDNSNIYSGPLVKDDKFNAWVTSIKFFLMNYKDYDLRPYLYEIQGMAYHQDERLLKQRLEILEAIKNLVLKLPKPASNATENLVLLFNKFHFIAKALEHRRETRETIIIKDEYDVQYLLNSLLQLFINDIRPEENTPSFGPKSSRMDFWLKEEEIVIEIKMTRDGLKDKELMDQLVLDKNYYKKHPGCKLLYFFVYDPQNRIKNRYGLISDLETDSFVKVFINP